MQRELPSFSPVLARRFFRRLQHVLRDPGQFSEVGDQRRKRVGCVEEILGKLRLEGREFFLDFGKAPLFLRGQLRSSQTVIAQVVLDAPALRLRQAVEIARSAQSLEFFVQTEVLRELGPVLSDLGQTGVVGSADRRVVVHRVQVGGHAPGARQPFIGVFQRFGELVPGRGRALVCKPGGSRRAPGRLQGRHVPAGPPCSAATRRNRAAD